MHAILLLVCICPAGLLLSLCADDAGREQVVKAKASGATGAPCCLVLHRCLANPAAAPRHAAALLSCLASNPAVGASTAEQLPWLPPQHRIDWSVGEQHHCDREQQLRSSGSVVAGHAGAPICTNSSSLHSRIHAQQGTVTGRHGLLGHSQRGCHLISCCRACQSS
jgi:hypothetical protein